MVALPLLLLPSLLLLLFLLLLLLLLLLFSHPLAHLPPWLPHLLLLSLPWRCLSSSPPLHVQSLQCQIRQWQLQSRRQAKERTCLTRWERLEEGHLGWARAAGQVQV